MKQRLRIGVFVWTCLCGIGTLASAAEGEHEEPVNPRKILEIGEKKDRSKIPYLRRVKAHREKQRHSAASNAQMALAKLGEKSEMAEIIAETKSDDPAVQYEAIAKLEYVGNKEAVRALVGLLDDMRIRRGLPTKGPDGKLHDSDVGFGPPSYAAMKALMKLVPDGPRLKGKYPGKDDAAAWKDWWKNNKQKYE